MFFHKLEIMGSETTKGLAKRSLTMQNGVGQVHALILESHDSGPFRLNEMQSCRARALPFNFSLKFVYISYHIGKISKLLN
jgi:hypothetical protein